MNFLLQPKTTAKSDSARGGSLLTSHHRDGYGLAPKMMILLHF
ncbi:MAG: hypothetical protein WBP08_06775 [Saprospiraceae bacterium]